MTKVLVIIAAEVRAFVQTKAFLFSLVLMPILSLGGSIASQRLADFDQKTRVFAVLDRTGILYPSIEAAAQERDRQLANGIAKHGRARFVPTLATSSAAEPLDEARLRLSDAVRRGEVYAFVEIPPDIAAIETEEAHKLRYVSDSPTYLALNEWIDDVLAKEIRSQRYRAAGMTPAIESTIERPVRSESFGLWERMPDGKIRASDPIDRVRLFYVPFGAAFLLFMLVMMMAPHLMQAVLEEKMSRISEVLLGSVTSFELMLGKLLASVVVVVALGGIYVLGALRVMAQFGKAGAVSSALVGWFFVFLVLAVLVYGSIWIAIGAAVSDMKEAQSLITPLVLFVMTPPFFMVRVVIESPSSPLATVASLVPLASPFLMLMRVGVHPSPPLWQVLLSVVLTVATAIACVWGAGRIFRVGLLFQGKAPSLGQLARWIFAKG